MRRTVAAAAALVLLAVIAARGVEIARDANDTALRQAATYQPGAGWQVVNESFEPWANHVVRGPVTMSCQRSGLFSSDCGAGPAWVVELAAPGNEQWRHYNAVVVISAMTGQVAGVSVMATN